MGNVKLFRRSLLAALALGTLSSCAPPADDGSEASKGQVESLGVTGDWDKDLMLDSQYKNADFSPTCATPSIVKVEFLPFAKMPSDAKDRYRAQINELGSQLKPTSTVAFVEVDPLAGQVTGGDQTLPIYVKPYWSFCTQSNATPVLEEVNEGKGKGFTFDPNATTNLGLIKWNNKNALFYIIGQTMPDATVRSLGDVTTEPLRLAVVNYCAPLTSSSGKEFSRSKAVSGDYTSTTK